MSPEELLQKLTALVQAEPPLPETFEVDELAKELDLSPLTVRAHLRAGR